MAQGIQHLTHADLSIRLSPRGTRARLYCHPSQETPAKPPATTRPPPMHQPGTLKCKGGTELLLHCSLTACSLLQPHSGALWLDPQPDDRQGTDQHTVLPGARRPCMLVPHTAAHTRHTAGGACYACMHPPHTSTHQQARQHSGPWQVQGGATAGALP
jgi:hypothetical protein